MSKLQRRIITLKDVAKATGYSVNTVSRALRKKEDIAPETREKIQRVAQDMGYINNTAAASLRLGRTNMIAVILGDISNPHFAIMMKEIETRARALGYGSFLINTNEDQRFEREAIQSALNKSVDGIILCPAQQSDDNVRFLMHNNVPFVTIGRRFPELPDAPYVVCNDELGGYQAAKHLLENGHREILMLSGPDYISSARERLLGYRRSHAEMGIEVNEDLVVRAPITSDGCAGAIQAMLARNLHFSAIFAFSDMIAWDAWAALRTHGLRVPEDVSVVGFDNIQSRLSLPFQLSTISSYKAMMSTQAVELLIARIHGNHAPSSVIDTRLVLGETVSRAAGGGPLWYALIVYCINYTEFSMDFDDGNAIIKWR